MSGKNIQVAIKVRPLLKKEVDLKLASNWKIINNSIQLIESQTDPFYFDHIFDQDVTNQIIFDKVAKPIVDATLEGFNGTIFAYGQTSSGKTYTMIGDDNNPGVIVLAAKEIFKEIENATDRKFLLRVGYIEIYNEKIYDLLNKNNQDLKIHETPNGDVSVNSEDFIITSESEMIHYLQSGNKLRKCGETNMNERSSRSHALFRLTIESRKVDLTNDDGCVQTSILNLVDLAGSERADQTGATGSRLNEGRHINRSLLYLSCVIKRLSENESDKYINYRDSKLTRILQASLGGNALTAIICTIKSTSIEETNSTLSFAMRAKTIKNKPEVNEILSDAAMMKRLEKEIMRLQNALEIEKNKNNKISEKQVLQLEKQIRVETLKIIHPSIEKKNTIRRRTWCPSSNEILLKNSKKSPSKETDQASNVQPMMYMTPLITMREEFESKDFNSLFDNKVSDCKNASNNFLDISVEVKTPNALKVNNKLSRLSLTPSYENRYKELLNEIEELKVFTNLEQKFYIEHDTVGSLSIRLEESQKRINELQNQEVELKLTIDNFMEKESSTLERLEESQKRINELQNQEVELKQTIDNFMEKESATLERLQHLQFECKEKNNIDYEFQQFKINSKNRVNELVESVEEKENTITSLKKELKNSYSEAHLKQEKISKLQSEMESENLYISFLLRETQNYINLLNEKCITESIATQTHETNKAIERINIAIQTDQTNNIDYEFQQFKINSKNRMNELVESVNEKENTITSLKEELKNSYSEVHLKQENITNLQSEMESENLYISFLLRETQNYINLLNEKCITESIATQTHETNKAIERINIAIQTDPTNNIDYEFQQFKMNSKNRMNELVESVNEKENTITSLKEELKNSYSEAHLKQENITNLQSEMESENLYISFLLRETQNYINLLNEKCITESIATQTHETNKAIERINIAIQTDQKNNIDYEFQEFKITSKNCVNELVESVKEKENTITSLKEELKNSYSEAHLKQEKISNLQSENESENLYISFLLRETQNYINLLNEKCITESIATQTHETNKAIERINIAIQTDQKNNIDYEFQEFKINSKNCVNELVESVKEKENTITSLKEELKNSYSEAHLKQENISNLQSVNESENLYISFLLRETQNYINLLNEKCITESIATQTHETNKAIERINIAIQTDQKNNIDYEFQEFKINSKNCVNELVESVKEKENTITSLKEELKNSYSEAHLKQENISNLQSVNESENLYISFLLRETQNYINLLNEKCKTESIATQTHETNKSIERIHIAIQTDQENIPADKLLSKNQEPTENRGTKFFKEILKCQSPIEIDDTRQGNQKERKCRRQSIHDEKRVFLWDSNRSVSTMTSPMNESCNCIQLDEKVSELRKQVLIKDCQLEALRMDMKINPLKDEIKMVRKMLLEEEREGRELLVENRDLRQLLTENKAQNDHANDELKSIKQKLKKVESVCAEQVNEITKISNECIELKRICNLRNEEIKELKKHISHETYNDENQYSNMEQQLKKLNEDNILLSKKYQDVKALCYVRIEEIQKLKQQLNYFEDKFDVKDLHDKYIKLSNASEDLKKLCRFRNEKIKKLEQQILHVKENSNEKPTQG